MYLHDQTIIIKIMLVLYKYPEVTLVTQFVHG